MPVTGDRQPWPWTVNADGQPLFFDDRADAMVETTRRLAHGAGAVDIGCMQVDLRAHRAAFRSLAEAFDPMLNVDYAAHFLLALHARAGRNWAAASGLYHSATPQFGLPYRAGVAAMQSRQRTSLAAPVTALPDGRAGVLPPAAGQ